MIMRMNSWRQLAAVSTFALLAACGSAHNQQQAQMNTAPSSNSTSAFMHSPTSAGTVLTTANGMTLYTYDKDTVGQSSCYGDCAQYWHPYLSNGTSMPSGKMTLITRSDGSQQWAYDGRPLYTFVQDTSSGQVNGNDFHNNWHVVVSS
jgi:predicted lipoprotein with Yx(FWY)xxD motif